jgi:hypothetical protein
MKTPTTVVTAATTTEAPPPARSPPKKKPPPVVAKKVKKAPVEATTTVDDKAPVTGGSSEYYRDDDENTKLSSSSPETTSVDTNNNNNNTDQHQQWVEFQQRISVDGFETGQTTTAIKVGKKIRQKDKKKMSENQRRILDRQRLTGTGGGEYPPLRFSDEETAQLLAQAYAALPKRTGRRGGRNLKRQERRWRLVREIRARQKVHIIAAHGRRMMKRHTKIKQIQEILATAPAAVRRDREYQLSVYRRWAATMGLSPVPALYVPPPPPTT